MDIQTVSAITIPAILALMFFGAGLTLSIVDLYRPFLTPKALWTGLSIQLIILPTLAILLYFTPIFDKNITAGAILLLLVPGGPGANFLSILCKGSTTLSVNLTVLCSTIILFTLPLGVNYLISPLTGTQLHLTSSSIFLLVLSMILIIIPPVLIGILVKKRNPELAKAIEPHIRTFSTVSLIFFAITIVTTQEVNVLENLVQVSFFCFLVVVTIYSICHLLKQYAHINNKEMISLTTCMGFQNAGLAFAVSTTLLGNIELSVAPALYLTISLPFSLIFIWFFNRNSSTDAIPPPLNHE